jgi:hypothetical protein
MRIPVGRVRSRSNNEYAQNNLPSVPLLKSAARGFPSRVDTTPESYGRAHMFAALAHTQRPIKLSLRSRWRRRVALTATRQFRMKPSSSLSAQASVFSIGSPLK